MRYFHCGTKVIGLSVRQIQRNNNKETHQQRQTDNKCGRVYFRFLPVVFRWNLLIETIINYQLHIWLEHSPHRYWRRLHARTVQTVNVMSHTADFSIVKCFNHRQRHTAENAMPHTEHTWKWASAQQVSAKNSVQNSVPRWWRVLDAFANGKFPKCLAAIAVSATDKKTTQHCFLLCFLISLTAPCVMLCFVYLYSLIGYQIETNTLCVLNALIGGIFSALFVVVHLSALQ